MDVAAVPLQARQPTLHSPKSCTFKGVGTAVYLPNRQQLGSMQLEGSAATTGWDMVQLHLQLMGKDNCAGDEGR